MKKSYFRQLGISFVFLFIFTHSSVSAQVFQYVDGKSYIDLNIANFRVENDSLKFSLGLKQGKDYRNGHGGLATSDIKFNLYLEPGVKVDNNPGSTDLLTIEQDNYGKFKTGNLFNYYISEAVVLSSVNGTTINPPAKSSEFTVKSFTFRINRAGDDITIDLPATDAEYAYVMDIKIPILSGTFTSASYMILRTTPYYDLNDVAEEGSIWGTYGPNDVERQGFRPEKPEWRIESDCPKLAIWTGAANTQNWITPGNWKTYNDEGALISDVIPGECTYVYVPGQGVTNYPLLKSTDDAVCSHIYFMSGAQLGRPDLLTYDSAHIQLNYGLEDTGKKPQLTYTAEELDALNLVEALLGSGNTANHLKYSATMSQPISRERWYMLSSPMKEMLAGDFGFGGFPISYLQKFGKNPKGDESSFVPGDWNNYFSSGTTRLIPGEGFVLWMSGYFENEYLYQETNPVVGSPAGRTLEPVQGVNGNTFGIGEVNGIIEFPFYENTYMSNARRIHQKTGSGSSFYSYWQWPLTYKLALTGYSVSTARTVDAYKLNTENIDYTIPSVANIAGGAITFVGNPYISSLDFGAFYTQNSALIKDAYQIWTGDQFETYTINGGDDQFIAPMQSFVVELNQGVTTGNLNFNVSTMSTVTPTVRLRSNRQSPANTLRIKAVNAFGSSNITIQQTENGKSTFSDADISKIIDYPVYSELPEIYSLKDMAGDQKKRALVINRIGKENISIPLGIVTTKSGETSFELSGMNNYHAEIYLIDMYADIQMINITNLETFEYPFIYEANLQGENAIANEERFYINIYPREGGTTGESDPELDDVTVYVHNKNIFAMSSLNNLIEQISVYDVQGRLLYHNGKVNAPTYKVKEFGILPEVCTVNVVTKNGTKNVKVIK